METGYRNYRCQGDVSPIETRKKAYVAHTQIDICRVTK
ncbi:hypothetical protein JCM19235_2350 [Vibrio maritimus]|uniref:Uncharacterized protein n=1 Tax=Vibrio maritimus TaxID=990268 RepID=A0A090SHI7_9VIBR|nr:hypothetical protein JCM19235_2350 [Vibrio maritimus]